MSNSVASRSLGLLRRSEEEPAGDLAVATGGGSVFESFELKDECEEPELSSFSSMPANFAVSFRLANYEPPSEALLLAEARVMALTRGLIDAASAPNL